MLFFMALIIITKVQNLHMLSQWQTTGWILWSGTRTYAGATSLLNFTGMVKNQWQPLTSKSSLYVLFQIQIFHHDFFLFICYCSLSAVFFFFFISVKQQSSRSSKRQRWSPSLTKTYSQWIRCLSHSPLGTCSNPNISFVFSEFVSHIWNGRRGRQHLVI